jgi:hypothetical protein
MISQVILEDPSPETILKYEYVFNSDEKLSATDRAVSKVFQLFPKNEKLDEVLLKVAILNSLYSTSIYALTDMAIHICVQKIDSQLDNRSLDVVERISQFNIGGKVRRNYSFATKYCSWHAPDFYPIFDGFVGRILWAYQTRDRYADFRREEMVQYEVYKTIHNSFRQHYGLMDFTPKQVDKFLWLHGKQLFS